MITPIQIELPTPYSLGSISSVNAWLFTEPEPTLIDCGLKTEESRLALEAGLAQQGLQLEDIQHIIITHAHEDHSGLARSFDHATLNAVVVPSFWMIMSSAPREPPGVPS